MARKSIARPSRASTPPPPPASSLADAELVEGIRRGNEAQFNELYRRYFQRVYNFTFLRVRNHADAEEIVQETFTAVFRSVEAFRGQSSLLSWIYGIAKNTVNNQLRRAKNRDTWLEKAEPELLRPSPGVECCSPEEHLSMRRYAETIHRRLDNAGDWQVEVFVLRHVENLSISEISARMERSSDAIRSSLYRTKRLLFEASQGDPISVGP